MSITGHRHRHSGIRHLSPVSEHSGTGLLPLILVLDWLQYRFLFFYSVIIQYGRARAENNMLSLIRKELRDSWI
jgi:hypothetical protein